MPVCMIDDGSEHIDITISLTCKHVVSDECNALLVLTVVAYTNKKALQYITYDVTYCHIGKYVNKTMII